MIFFKPVVICSTSDLGVPTALALAEDEPVASAEPETTTFFFPPRGAFGAAASLPAAVGLVFLTDKLLPLWASTLGVALGLRSSAVESLLAAVPSLIESADSFIGLRAEVPLKRRLVLLLADG